MRATSYVQKRLLAEVFAPLPKEALEWAQKKIFAPYAATYLTAGGKTRVTWCMECGHIDRAANVLPNNPEFTDGWTCPSCHCHVNVKNMTNTLTSKAVKQGCISESKYIIVLDVRHEWQVFKCFEMRRQRYAGSTIEYCCPELFRIFINSKGVEHIVSRDYVRTPYHFRWLDTWSLKMHNGGGNGYYMFDDLYDLQGIVVAPGGRVLPEFKKMGLSASVLRNTPYDPARLCLCVARFPQAETLYKSRQKALLEDILRIGKKSRVLHYWPSVKIALRHGYKPLTDMLQIWLDYVDGLVREGKDIRNPHYICPADLQRAHLAQIERDMAKKTEDDHKKYNKALQERISTIASVVVCDGNISLRPLQTVEDFHAEGLTLHHCVFTNRYYTKPDSIILSACVNDQRMETIELDARTLEILQCRGAYNQDSKYHSAILGVLEANKERFRLSNRN